MRLIARGRVQGVGFRWFVKNSATALALCGWVRNRRDGSVELEVDDTPSALQELQRQLLAGNNWCRVDSLTELSEQEETADDNGSKVRF